MEEDLQPGDVVMLDINYRHNDRLSHYKGHLFRVIAISPRSGDDIVTVSPLSDDTDRKNWWRCRFKKL